MVHSEVYMNKYVVSIAPFSPPHSENCSFFFLILHPFFQRGQLTPLALCADPMSATPGSKRLNGSSCFFGEEAIGLLGVSLVYVTSRIAPTAGPNRILSLQLCSTTNSGRFHIFGLLLIAVRSYRVRHRRSKKFSQTT